jgi:heme exporter protein B
METSFSTSAKSAAVSDNWWAEARAVLVKDLRSELRTKAALGAILVFSLTTIILLSYLIETTGLGLTQAVEAQGTPGAGGAPTIFVDVKTVARAKLLSSLLWIVIYFSAMAGLPRVFLKEEEMRTAAALRLNARPSAVFAGKLGFNVLLLVGISLLVLPMFVFFMKPDVANWASLIAHVLLGVAGMAAGATILGAMVARTGGHGYLMVVLGFGPLLPILILAINGTTSALFGSGGNNVAGLVSYLIAMVVLSAGLFEKVWGE